MLTDRAQIQYAVAQGRPFLAVSGGHGATWALGGVENGIAIAMRGLVFVDVAADGASAVIGGGTQSGEVIAALWAVGKQACEYLYLSRFLPSSLT